MTRPIALFVAALAATVAGIAGRGIAQPARQAKCPVSGKTVEVGEKTPKVYIQGRAHYFCCQNCPKTFAKSPEKWIRDVGDCPVLGGSVSAADPNQRVVINNGLWYVCCPGCVSGVPNSNVVLKELEDVVSGKKFKATPDSPRSEYQGQIYFFATPETKAAFDKEPAKYAVVYGK